MIVIKLKTLKIETNAYMDTGSSENIKHPQQNCKSPNIAFSYKRASMT
jgi:hypothetical protein